MTILSSAHHKLSKRDFVKGAGSSLLLPALAGVSHLAGSSAALADEAALLAAAKKEGKLTFYSVVPQQAAQDFIDGFTKKYGLEMDYQRLTTGPLVQRFVAETQSGNFTADAIAVTDNFFFEDAASKGWLAAIGEVPAAGAYPAQFMDKTSATVQLLPHQLTYNTQALPTAPSDWNVLIDPKWKGKVIILDPRNGFFTTVWYYALQQKYGSDFLKALMRQEPIMVQSAVQGVQQLAAGAAALCAPAYPNLMPELQAKGAPVGLASVDPVIASGVYLGISAKAPHPNAARLLAHYLMSADGQAAYNKGSVAPLGNLPGTLPLPKITNVDLRAAQQAQKDIFALLGLS